jgi:two-component system chemotaxis response regulator CheB
MPRGFTKSLAERLNSISQLDISEAVDGDELTAGRVLIAPGDKHMKIANFGGRFFVKLTDEPPIEGLRPSVDKMMTSLAECNIPLIGVILTGMGHDGVIGLKKINAVNGYTIAEHESTCIVYGMPRAAVENNCVDKTVPLPLVAKTILDNL